MIARSSRRSITLKVSDSARPGSASRVIDEQPRQIEHPGHPGDDRDDVEGLEPGSSMDPGSLDCRPARALTSLLTCSGGVSGRMPWPRLKMKRPPLTAPRGSRSTPSSERIAAGHQPQRIEIALHGDRSAASSAAQAQRQAVVEPDRIDARLGREAARAARRRPAESR